MNPDPNSLTVVGAVGAGVYGLSNMAKGLLERALGPVADEIGEHLRTRVHGYLEANRHAALNRAAEMVEASGREPHQVPLRTMLPLLEGASLEDDEQLRERWAALLANATVSSEKESVPPLYAAILRNLSPQTARTLEVLRVRSAPRRGENLSRTLSHNKLREKGGVSIDFLTHELFAPFASADDEEQATARTRGLIDALVREGLAEVTPALEYDWPFRTEGPKLSQRGLDIRITYLGLQFLLACLPPSTLGSSSLDRTRPADPSGT